MTLINSIQIKPITIRLVKEETNTRTIKSKNELIQALQKSFDSYDAGTFYYSDIKDQDILDICEDYSITYNEGVRQGSYGSSTGEIFPGFTLYCPLELFQECYDIGMESYLVNPLHEIESYNGRLLNLTEEQIDGYIDTLDASDIDYTRGNTYNDELEGCEFMVDMDFYLIGNPEDENSSNLLIAKFHCGGDIRGNYTRLYAFKFDSIDDLYGALMPSREILDYQQNFNEWLKFNDYKDVIISVDDFPESNDINGICDYTRLDSTVIEVTYQNEDGTESQGYLDTTLATAIINDDFTCYSHI